jgi:phosphoribosylaminoimidazole carboxylase (NCAIR synthetase)
MKKSKTIIIIGAGYYQKAAVIKAKEMGFYVLAVDRDKNAEGANIADFHLLSSAHDEKEVLEKVGNLLNYIPPVSGVLSGGARGCIYATAVLANKLNLYGNGIKKAKILSDKYLMRKSLSEFGLNRKSFLKVNGLKELLNFLQGKRVVLKSSDSSGGEGLFLVENAKDCEEKYNFLKNTIKSDIFAEEYIEGIDIGVSAIAYKREIFITGVYDILPDNDKFGKIEQYIIPSKINDEDRIRIVGFSKTAFGLMGIENGPCSLELKLSKDKQINLIEIEANIPGSFIAEHLMEKSTGKSYTESAILSVSGSEPEKEWIVKKSVSVVFKNNSDYEPELNRNYSYRLRKIGNGRYAYLFL